MLIDVIRSPVRGRRSAALSCALCLVWAVSACSVETTGDGDAAAGSGEASADATALDGAADAADAPATAAVYDSALAAELGADDYGMARYVMALLRTGPNRDIDSATAAELQRAHLDNITRMAEEGDLLLAGPFLDDGDIRGIYVFDVETVEEARELTETDPAIREGLLEMELHPWYGSAAVRALYEINLRVQKERI